MSPSSEAEKTFPLQIDVRYERPTRNLHGAPRLPERIARLAYRSYEHVYPSSARDQSFDRIHERGGFSIDEVFELLASEIERLDARDE